ncbi:uncharacterized protein N7515_008793 [Penicillium bovifimosum]|uniref:Uncharacterized protein n=1 Tax=Penicillium bovifimosum TaxID=126998 RepID=A0A9W9GNN0_9EURO|nr:uncharacterized protein N7515_008793 [Penicillium bovifimosum]KAJ5124968.1 hypothetical protein N7515_008793 [Penicillium bovifimosum]
MPGEDYGEERSPTSVGQLPCGSPRAYALPGGGRTKTGKGATSTRIDTMHQNGLDSTNPYMPRSGEEPPRIPQDSAIAVKAAATAT